jgi:WD40 repeat protein
MVTEKLNSQSETATNDLFVKSQTFKGHSDSVSALVYDDSHGVLYTASLDNTIRVS